MFLVGLVVGCLAKFLRQRILCYLAAKEFLYAFEKVYLIVGDECDGNAVALSACRTADAVDIVFNIARNVVVDDHLNVVDVYAACHNVGSHENIDVAGLEAEHHLVTLSLRQVGMHGATADILLYEAAMYLLDTLLLAGEDDDPLLLGLEYLAQDGILLRRIADISRLLYLLSRLGDGYLHVQRVFEERLGKVFNLAGHGGREHYRLACLRNMLGNGEDVVRKSHIEHAVSLVEDEEREVREVDIVHLHVGYQSARRSYDHRSTFLQRRQLVVVAVAVVAAIYRHAAYAVEIVSESLHGLVYLLCQLACGSHDETVHRIILVASVVKARDDWKQIGCRLAGAGLRHTHDVTALDDRVYACCLNGSTGLETHIVQGIEDVVVKKGLFEIFLLHILSHYYVCQPTYEVGSVY